MHHLKYVSNNYIDEQFGKALGIDIREILATVELLKDFPIKGVTFLNIIPLLTNPKLFRDIEKGMTLLYNKILSEHNWEQIDYIISPESRGFIFGSIIAVNQGVPFIPLRKANKLPDYCVDKISSDNEYAEGVDLYFPNDIKLSGKNCLIIDDINATGGTYRAISEFINIRNGNCLGELCLFNLIELNQDSNIHALVDVIISRK